MMPGKQRDYEKLSKKTQERLLNILHQITILPHVTSSSPSSSSSSSSSLQTYLITSPSSLLFSSLQLLSPSPSLRLPTLGTVVCNDSKEFILSEDGLNFGNKKMGKGYHYDNGSNKMIELSPSNGTNNGIKRDSVTMAAEDELDILVRRAEELRMEEEYQNEGVIKRKQEEKFEKIPFIPYLIIPTYVEESAKAGQQSRARRRKRVKILYDVMTSRAQVPAFLDVSRDDPKTPLAFRYIRIILLTAEARKAQDIHLDQNSSQSLSVVFVTQLGSTRKVVINGAVAQSIVYYIAFYDLLTAGKPMPGPVRDYSLKIKVRTHAFLQGTHNIYRVNCIRTNHELGYYHIVMRVLQS